MASQEPKLTESTTTTTENQAEKKVVEKKKASEKGKRSEQTGKGGMIDVNPVAGTRDFLPPQMRVRNWLFAKFRETARLFGFEEYDAPILEPEDLYKRKAGEEIVEQMYNFKDKTDLPVALRPEMTPSLARLILQAGRALLLPVKWFSIPQCWRYETTTRGRKREHYQWNMDIWGIEGVSAEAELVAAIVHFFKSVGLTSKDVGIKVSSRKVIQSVLESVGIVGDQFKRTCIVIDKMDKLEKHVLLEEMEKVGVTKETSEIILASLGVKSLDDLAARLGEEHVAVKDLRQFFSFVKSYGLDDFVTFDASIVRGLSYYTGIVFEGFARTGELTRAVCGGGRYDEILTTYKAKQNIPACGFGFGDVVILELLMDKKLVPELNHQVDDIIIPYSEDLRAHACQVASLLRSSGRTVDIVLKKAKVATAYSYADRIGAVRAILIAPDEWNRGAVCVKYLREGGQQFEVQLDKLLEFEQERPGKTFGL